MKNTLLLLSLAALSLLSCRKDEPEIIPEVSIETQNSYDDQAAQDFLQTHYLDERGKIKSITDADTAKVKLADMVPAPVVLPSGVIYIVREGAQPVPGTEVGTYDELHLMTSTYTYIAADVEGKVKYQSPTVFRSTIMGTGVPEIDPWYYYVKNSVLETAPFEAAKQRSYYEIEGFQEAIRKFRAFDLPEDAAYNLQGVIIVPSRAAFARDPHYSFNTGITYRNRSFVFNFQLYKSVHHDGPR